MSSVQTLESLDLDLSIEVRRLNAPSDHVEDATTHSVLSSPENQRKMPLTVQANCGTDVWDCTAPWVCG